MKKVTKNEVSETIREGNEIARAIYKMTSAQQTLVYFALYKIDKQFNPVRFLELYGTEEGKHKINYTDYVAKFTIEEMCKVMRISYYREMKAHFLRDLDTCAKTVFKIKDKNNMLTKWIPFFSYAQFNQDTEEVEINFNKFFFDEVFAPKRYSRGNLEILGQLRKNFYAQRLYFYLQSFRNMQGEKYSQKEGIWCVQLSVEEFRLMLCIEDGELARNDNLKRSIITALDLINKVNFEFDTDVEFIGKPYQTIKFTCIEKIPTLKPLPTEKKQRYEVIEANNQIKLMKRYQKRYQAEWEETKNTYREIPGLDLFSKEQQEKSLDWETFKHFYKQETGKDYEA